ncbi:MAG TPA: acylphosphatase [Patescibacteria group bacterium]
MVETMQQAHFIVSGFVQGVGYRRFVRHIAKKLSLTGWVRNNIDGTVEGVVIGQKEIIEKLVEACKKGPFLSTVDNIHVTYDEPQQAFEDFQIRHD